MRYSFRSVWVHVSCRCAAGRLMTAAAGRFIGIAPRNKHKVLEGTKGEVMSTKSEKGGVKANSLNKHRSLFSKNKQLGIKTSSKIGSENKQLWIKYNSNIGNRGYYQGVRANSESKHMFAEQYRSFFSENKQLGIKNSSKIGNQGIPSRCAC